MIKQEVYWYTKGTPEMSPLKENISADTVIIGGGMAGLISAYKLIATGQKIAVIEKDFCGGGATGKSSGFITPDSELEFSDLVTRFGLEDARTLWQFALGGVEMIRGAIEKENIECDYQIQDSLFIANNDKTYKIIEEEYDLLSKNFSGSRLYKKDEMPSIIGSDTYAGAIRYDKTYGINGYLFCLNFKKALQGKDVQIFENTEVTHIEKSRVTTKKGYSIEAKHIIVTLDRFLPDLGIYPKEIYHAQNFLTMSKVLTDAQVKALFPDEKLMTWDSDLIYQYFRVTGENRLLFGASNMLYTYLPSVPKKSEEHLLPRIEKYIQEKFDKLPAPIEIEYFWPGLIGVSKDLLPICGEISGKNIYYISGAAGLPWAAACAGYVSEKIISKRSDLDRFFTAKRKFPIGRKIQAILSKPIAFALSHGIVKYFNR